MIKRHPHQVDSKTFLSALHASQSWVLLRIVFGALARYFPNPKWKRDCQTLYSFVDHYVDLALEEEEKLQKLKPTAGERPKKDSRPFSLVRRLAKQTPSRYEIRSQVIQSILAMQDTTSTLLSNTIFLLSRNPIIWTSLREEVRGKKDELTAKELRSMTLLQNVLKECEYSIYSYQLQTKARKNSHNHSSPCLPSVLYFWPYSVKRHHTTNRRRSRW